MTLVAEGGQIQVKTTIVTDFGDRAQDDRYVFDGAEHDIVSAGLGTGRRSATRVDDRVFKSVDHLKGPTGETTIERSFALVEGSNELTIDLTSEGFGGRTQSHRVFTRGDHPPSAPGATSRLFPVDLTVPVAPSPFERASWRWFTSFRSGIFEGATLNGTVSRCKTTPGARWRPTKGTRSPRSWRSPARRPVLKSRAASEEG